MRIFNKILVKDVIQGKRKVHPTILDTQTIQDALHFFKSGKIDELVVLNQESHLVGILPIKTMVQSLSMGEPRRLVREVVRPLLITLHDFDPLTKAFEIFTSGQKIIPLIKNDGSFLTVLELSDIRPILQQRLDLLEVDFDNLPLNLLDSRRLLKLLKGISDDSNIRICITDEKGILRFFNRAYEELTGINRQDAIGKHVTKIFPETRLPHVLETGKSEIRYYRSSFEDRYIVSRRIPLKKGDKIIGALSLTLFRDITEMEDLLHRFNIITNKMIYYKKELESIRFSKYRIENIIGQTQQILHLKDLIHKYAQGDSTILILGESGTGKELIAHAIHQGSRRKHHPLIMVNCASIPKDLLESELFGYEAGSFTGAHQKGKLGKFELAHKGTICLDEIGDMPLDIQAKLLRVLQEREIERIGGKTPIPIDFRLISSTNKNLDTLVEEGKFRPDLYYRIKVLTLIAPPLRDRKQDIPLIAQFILDQLNSKLRKNINSVNEKVLRSFEKYHWPGNVRELENVMEYAVNNAHSNSINRNCLPPFLKESYEGQDSVASKIGKLFLPELRNEFEKSLIIEALNKTRGNRKKAAIILGTSRSGLYKLIKKFDID